MKTQVEGAAANAAPPRAKDGWQIRCATCGRTRLLSEVGGIRIGAVSIWKRTVIHCSECGGLREGIVEPTGASPLAHYPQTPMASSDRVAQVLITFTVLSAVGIAVSGMMGWNVPSPVHMVALTMVFATLAGLMKAFAPQSSNQRPPALPRKKDVGIAYFFWFILGPSGLHKFYLGQIGWGLLYFFTAGLFLVGWLIDLFTLPSQVRRVNGGSAE